GEKHHDNTNTYNTLNCVHGGSSSVFLLSSQPRIRFTRGNVESDFGDGLLTHLESIVDLPLLGARVQQALSSCLQVRVPEKVAVLRANQGSGGGAIQHLPAGRVVIETVDLLFGHLVRRSLVTARLAGYDDIDPGSALGAIHRELCGHFLIPIVD